MKPRIVELSGVQLIGATAFHETFSRIFGFPDFYGRNMDAWIDCMSYLRHPDEKMSTLHIGPAETLTLLIQDYKKLRDTAPKQWTDLIECSAFVNLRAIESGEMPLIALALE